MGLQEAMEYRVDFVMTLASLVFPVVTSVYIWVTVNQDSANLAKTGYSYPQLLMYTILAALLSKLMASGFESDINEDIKMGGLNKYLVKPISYMKYRFFAFWGNKLPGLILFLVLTAACLCYFTAVYHVTVRLSSVFLFLVALSLAVVLRFFLFFCVAMWSFWFAEASGMFGSIQVIIWVISGGIFPVTIFGEAVTKISVLLPFSYLTQFCIDIINGRLDTRAIGQGLAMQGCWILGFWMLACILWNKGLKNYVAVGG